MERASAFQPKKKTPEGLVPSTEVVREEPLKSLEEDTANVAVFNQILDFISKNDFSSDTQIEAFITPRFRFVYDEGTEVLIDAENRVIKTKKGPIRKSAVGAGLNRKQLLVLQELLAGQLNSKTESAKADDEIKNYALSLKVLLENSQMGSTLAQSLITPRFRFVYDEGTEVLIDAENRVIKTKKGPIRKSAVGAGMSRVQADLIKEMGSIFGDTNIPNEVKENFRRVLENSDEKAPERMGSIMEMSAGEDTKERITGLFERISANQRSTALRAEIYGGLAQDLPTTELSARLAEYEERDLTDRQLASTLQSAIAAKRRFNNFSKAIDPLVSKKRNIDEVLSNARALTTSPSELDQRAGALLVSSVYRAELADFRKRAQDLITKDVDPGEFRRLTESLPIRPSFEDLDYVDAVVDVRERGLVNIADIEKNRRLDLANRIRDRFAKAPIAETLASINDFPAETEEDIAIKLQLLATYKTFVATKRPQDFDQEFSTEIQARQAAEQKALFISPERGRNKEAFDYVRERFVESIYPLIESLRADATTAKTVQAFLEPERVGGKNPRRQFEQRLARLEAQRPLTDTERSYFESVELLSFFNPYLVAAVYADEGVTSEFLRHHFETLSNTTLENLKEGDYIPLIQIGTGPNGTAALGELVRNNPELARQTLVVDAGAQPGGPFAIPEGAAWELNSANRRGAGGATLPSAPGANEISTVRAYGSPLRWYPGERANDRSIRQGSINVTVDYLPTPDDLSQARYPTNEELQTILSLQNALLAERMALNTRVIEVKSNLDEDARGDKLVTLEIGGADPRTITIATDAIIASTGLGEASYGFKLEGSRAARIIAETEDTSSFPKISKTLDAFQALAGRSAERASPGETLVIYGKGNSADTLIEYIGNIFQGDNPRVRDVTKIYVVADGTLSARPRYAQINDLRPRNGRGNLIEQVVARVADIDYESRDGAPNERKLVLLDQNGQRITDEAGRPIVADAAIAATGFRPELDGILEKYSNKKTGARENIREPLTLPTNPDVPVAQTLKGDPTVLIVGTSSDAEFEKADKLNQLPREAREALLRNGAENAVAIGFRAPDTQAAANIWLNTQDITLEPSTRTLRPRIEMNEGTQVNIDSTAWLPTRVDTENITVPNNITNEIRILSPLLAYNVGNAIELSDPSRSSGNFTGEITFEMTSNPDQRLGLTFKGGSVTTIPEALVEVVKDACADPDFEKYAYVALQKKRRNQRLDIVLSFKNGKLDPSSTFVQS